MMFDGSVSWAAFLAVVAFGFLVRNALFRKLKNFAQGTASRLDDIIIDSLRGPFMLWFVMLGIYAGLDLSSAPKDMVLLAGKILFVLGVLSVTLVLSSISTRLIGEFSGRLQTALPIASLTQSISRIILFLIAILIILNRLGISITPILATLGVGSLAVALALQDTLSNLFSGLHIILTKQIRVGDYVKLESGEEGYVTDITWRTTKVRMLPNNVVLVPNEKLTKSVITNFHLPEKEMSVLVDLGVHYDSDLKKVESVTCEVARQVMQEVPGGVPGFGPFIRFHTFGDFSIQLSVILRAREFVDQYLIKHEFIKRLQERYRKEGIVIPYPIRALNYRQEGVEK